MNCDELLLSGSVAGLLTAEESRSLREHLAGCAACRARLEQLSAVAAGLKALPLPPSSASLTARTQALLAAEIAAQADRRQAAVLAGAVGLGSWILTLCGLWACDLVDVGWWWAAGWAALPVMVLPAVAAIRRVRIERSLA
jgi:anti-sigma factor RsiW